MKECFVVIIVVLGTHVDLDAGEGKDLTFGRVFGRLSVQTEELAFVQVPLERVEALPALQLVPALHLCRRVRLCLHWHAEPADSDARACFVDRDHA